MSTPYESLRALFGDLDLDRRIDDFRFKLEEGSVGKL